MGSKTSDSGRSAAHNSPNDPLRSVEGFVVWLEPSTDAGRDNDELHGFVERMADSRRTSFDSAEALLTVLIVSLRQALLALAVFSVPLLPAVAFAQMPPGLVSWWTADGNTLDSSDGNTGTLVNGATFAPGLVNQAFSFDGTDDYVDFGNPGNLNFGLGDFTLVSWVNTTFLGPPANDMIVAKISVGSDSQFALAYGAGGPGGGIRVDGAPFLFVASAPPDPALSGFAESPCSIADGDFHQVVGVRAGSALEVYVDGQLVATAVTDDAGGVPTVVNATSSNAVTVGGRVSALNAAYFNGLIDEVQIYDRALEAQEIKGLFDLHDDGSTSECIKSIWTFTGIAVGGSTVEWEVDGVMLSITTVVGEDGADIARAVADAINGNPTLQGFDIGAYAKGSQVGTNGTVTNTTINDPGISHGIPAVPALAVWGLLLLAGLMLLAGSHDWRRASSATH